MNTAALDLEGVYSKVITARFVTKRDRVTPLHCMTCNAVLVMGDALAAVTGSDWHNYCSECASTPAAQVRGLLSRVIEMGVEVDAHTADTVRTFLTAESAGTFRAAKASLMVLRQEAGKRAAEIKRAETIASLMDDENYVGLALFVQHISPNHRDAGFATSLLQQWEAKGSLSERQMIYVAKFAKRGLDAAAKAEPDPDLPTGLYIDQVGNVCRIYMRSHRLLARSFNGTTFTNDIQGVRRTAKGVTAGTHRLLTGDEAAAYGRQHHRCFNCLSMGRPGELSDDRSIAAGYGERCAEVNGWSYPTAEQAAAILRPHVH